MAVLCPEATSIAQFAPTDASAIRAARHIANKWLQEIEELTVSRNGYALRTVFGTRG